MCNNNVDCSCFSRIIERIIGLQQQGDSLNDFGCDRPFLGNIISNLGLNTRPITFYGNTGEQFIFPYTLNGTDGTSGVFRVENLDDCCCRCRILAPNPDATATIPYIATESFFTINLNCICAMQCLGDTFVSGL
ncbi:MAG: hypothetical protein IJN90_02195 [Bacilli bacterium]|nr:hypothetical protein [Bacilli bacterium]